jgi:hypothetical protein
LKGWRAVAKGGVPRRQLKIAYWLF